MNNKFLRITLLLFVLGLSLYFFFLRDDRYKRNCLYMCYSEPQRLSKFVYNIPKLYRPITFRTDFFGMTYLGNSGNLLDDEVLFFGAAEKEVLYFLRDVAQHLASKKRVFLDVGANVGQHSLFMSQYVGQVHSFEPYPPVYGRFEEMIKINNIQNIFLHKIGLGNTEEVLTFREPSQSNLGGGSFAHNSEPSQTAPKFNIVIGDNWSKQQNLRSLDLMKVDVEGFEKNVLLGFSQTLQEYRPLIVMELNIDDSVSFSDRNDFLSAFPKGYDFYRFSRECNPLTGEYFFEPYTFSKAFSNFNIVALPTEHQGHDLIRKALVNRKTLSKE